MPSLPRVLTLRLAPHQQEAVRQLAERAGVSEEEAVLRAVEQVSEAPTPTAYDLMKKHIGSFEGPPGLSTNETYREGFGAWRTPGEEE